MILRVASSCSLCSRSHSYSFILGRWIDIAESELDSLRVASDDTPKSVWEEESPASTTLAETSDEGAGAGASGDGAGETSPGGRSTPTAASSASPTTTSATALDSRIEAAGLVASEWEYRDVEGEVHGAFSSKQMLEWWIDEHFDGEFSVTVAGSEEWGRLDASPLAQCRK